MNESVGAGSLNGFCRKGQTGYVYNAEGRRVYAADGEGSHEYLYDGRSLLAEYLGGGLERSYIYGEKLLGLATASGDYSLHLDPLGSVLEITGGAQGRSDCSRAYDPWGSFDETGTCSGDSALAYTGHQYDSSSGWYYFGARYYDPAVARFLRMDPYFGDTNVPPSLHKYMYAYDNPYKWWDPTGENTLFIPGAGDNSASSGYSYSIATKMEEKQILNPSIALVSAKGGKPANIFYAMRRMSEPDTPDFFGVDFEVTDQSTRDDGQRNLVGYSYGSVVAAQVALQLAESGEIVDNVILIGSPISSDSDLYKALESSKNIKKVSRIDIKDDPLSNGIGFDFWNLNNHFYYDNNQEGQQDDLVDTIKIIVSDDDLVDKP